MTAPLSALTDTWNAIGTAFTAIKMTVTNTASAAGSKLFDLIVGSTSMFQVGKNGHIAVGAGAVIDGPDEFDDVLSTLATYAETLTAPIQAFNYGIYSRQTLDFAANDLTGSTYEGGLFEIYVPATNSKDCNGYLTGLGYNMYIFGTGTYNNIYGNVSSVVKEGGVVSNLYGVVTGCSANNSTIINAMYAASLSNFLNGTTTVPIVYGLNINLSSFGDAYTCTTYVGVWQEDLTPNIHVTNPYYWWTNGPGVTRIREEGATKGGVYSWYNPAFTKYTPGAMDFERGILQWNTGNVLEIGAEAGGTGTLRKIRHLGAGHIFPLANLPTSDPGVAGQLFTSGAPSAGVPKALMISGG